jgi:hypothetical protein
MPVYRRSTTVIMLAAGRLQEPVMTYKCPKEFEGVSDDDGADDSGVPTYVPSQPNDRRLLPRPRAVRHPALERSDLLTCAASDAHCWQSQRKGVVRVPDTPRVVQSLSYAGTASRTTRWLHRCAARARSRRAPALGLDGGTTLVGARSRTTATRGRRFHPFVSLYGCGAPPAPSTCCRDDAHARGARRRLPGGRRLASLLGRRLGRHRRGGAEAPRLACRAARRAAPRRHAQRRQGASPPSLVPAHGRRPAALVVVWRSAVGVRCLVVAGWRPAFDGSSARLRCFAPCRAARPTAPCGR